VYQQQYLVSISSPLPVYINNEETSNYTSWVNTGSILTLTDHDYVFNNGTMFVPSIGNETIVVADPVSLVINWYPEYLVTISSALPISVNGELTTNYTAWLSPGSLIALTTHVYVLTNGTMLIPSAGNETLTVNAPTTLVIAWSPRYLVTVTSTMLIYVNGQLVSNYTAWLSPGTTLTIRAPTYSAYGGLVLYQPNTTTLTLTLTISKPTKLTITYTPNYTRVIILTITAITIIAAASLLIRRHKTPQTTQY
jgi:thermopsin